MTDEQYRAIDSSYYTTYVQAFKNLYLMTKVTSLTDPDGEQISKQYYRQTLEKIDKLVQSPLMRNELTKKEFERLLTTTSDDVQGIKKSLDFLIERGGRLSPQDLSQLQYIHKNRFRDPNVKQYPKKLTQRIKKQRQKEETSYYTLSDVSNESLLPTLLQSLTKQQQQPTRQGIYKLLQKKYSGTKLKELLLKSQSEKIKTDIHDEHSILRHIQMIDPNHEVLIYFLRNGHKKYWTRQILDKLVTPQNANYTDSNYGYPLYYILMSSNIDDKTLLAVQELLRKGADVNKSISHFKLTRRTTKEKLQFDTILGLLLHNTMISFPDQTTERFTHVREIFSELINNGAHLTSGDLTQMTNFRSTLNPAELRNDDERQLLEYIDDILLKERAHQSKFHWDEHSTHQRRIQLIEERLKTLTFHDKKQLSNLLSSGIPSQKKLQYSLKLLGKGHPQQIVRELRNIGTRQKQKTLPRKGRHEFEYKGKKKSLQYSKQYTLAEQDVAKLHEIEQAISKEFPDFIITHTPDPDPYTIYRGDGGTSLVLQNEHQSGLLKLRPMRELNIPFHKRTTTLQNVIRFLHMTRDAPPVFMKIKGLHNNNLIVEKRGESLNIITFNDPIVEGMFMAFPQLIRGWEWLDMKGYILHDNPRFQNITFDGVDFGIIDVFDNIHKKEESFNFKNLFELMEVLLIQYVNKLKKRGWSAHYADEVWKIIKELQSEPFYSSKFLSERWQKILKYCGFDVS